MRIHPVLPDIRYNQDSLEYVSHIKYLEIIIDNKLSFKLHIADVSRRLSKIRGVKYSVFGFLNRESLMTLHYSLVYSHINQSIVIWSVASRCNILRIILHVEQDDYNIPEIGTHER